SPVPRPPRLAVSLRSFPDCCCAHCDLHSFPTRRSSDLDLIEYARRYGSDVKLMADVSTVEEAITAEELGFDCVSTTLVGYTEQSEGMDMSHDDFKILKEMVQAVSVPVIAEGKIDTPQKARQALENGAHFIVVGGAITRPQQITERFSNAVKEI